jgi:hypothetical protein
MFSVLPLKHSTQCNSATGTRDTPRCSAYLEELRIHITPNFCSAFSLAFALRGLLLLWWSRASDGNTRLGEESLFFCICFGMTFFVAFVSFRARHQ